MPAAITAVGAVTAHGLGVEALWDGLLSGRTAIRPLTRFPTDGLCSQLGAEAPDDQALSAAAAMLNGRPASDRASRLLLAAAAEALSGPSARVVSPQRLGVVIGTTKGAFEPSAQGGNDALGIPARALAEACCARGPVLTVSAACASSAYALGEALGLLEDGRCDRVIVGGTESLLPFVYQGFHALKALSATPAAPFDARRSGLSLGEGAAVLVLESERWAGDSESASPIAWLEGFGASSDSHDQTAPDPRGAGLAIACARALNRSGQTADAVGHYHAHGTATRHNDRMEAAVHAALFKGRAVPLTGVKGSVGHTLGAAGAIDAVVCALSLARGWIPPVVNLVEVDPAAAVPAVMGKALQSTTRRALVATAGFGGVNGALVIAR